MARLNRARARPLDDATSFLLQRLRSIGGGVRAHRRQGAPEAGHGRRRLRQAARGARRRPGLVHRDARQGDQPAGSRRGVLAIIVGGDRPVHRVQPAVGRARRPRRGADRLRDRDADPGLEHAVADDARRDDPGDARGLSADPREDDGAGAVDGRGRRRRRRSRSSRAPTTRSSGASRSASSRRSSAVLERTADDVKSGVAPFGYFPAWYGSSSGRRRRAAGRAAGRRA